MGNLKKLNNQIDKMIYEASLGRLVQHLSYGYCFAFISAERSENTKAENDKATKDLRSYATNLAKGLKVGYIKAKGGYVEISDIDGSRQEIDGENSIILYAKPEQFDIIKTFAISMGKKFKQDSIMLVDPNGVAKWVATIEGSTVGNQIGKSEMIVGTFHPKQIGLYYSKVGKKSFSFTSLNEGFIQQSKFTSIEKRSSVYFCNILKECQSKGLIFHEVLENIKNYPEIKIKV